MIANYTDHAANERTYLAWVRTGVTVMVLGFFVERFEIFLQMSGDPSMKADMAEGSAFEISLLAVFLAALGILTIAWSTIHYVRTNRAIDAEESLPFKDLTLPLVLSALLFVFGSVLLLSLLRFI